MVGFAIVTVAEGPDKGKPGAQIMGIPNEGALLLLVSFWRR